MFTNFVSKQTAIALLLSPIFLLNLSFADELTEKYKQSCGGKYYSKCNDKNGLSQLSLFNEAREKARNEGKGLLLIVGADWCPACHKVAAELNSKNAETDSLFSKVVTVSINNDVSSGNELLSDLNAPVFGIPMAIYIDPKSLEVKKTFFASIGGVKGLNKNAESIWPSPRNEKNGAVAKANSAILIGHVAATTLEKDISLLSGLTLSQQKVTIEQPDPIQAQLALKYYNQGLTLLHLFQYVDAYKSFKKAIRLSLKFPMAHVGLVAASLNFSDDGEQIIQSLMTAQKQISEMPLITQKEKIWLDYAMIDTCATEGGLSCAKLSINTHLTRLGMPWVGPMDVDLYMSHLELAMKKLIQDMKPLNDPDFISIMIFNSGESEDFEKLIPGNENHTGVVHYASHIYENMGQYEKALQFSTRLVKLNPSSAHAHHMRGHVLPLIDKWAEATIEFEKADKLHAAWVLNNHGLVTDDWHHVHNLDLLSKSLYITGRKKEAAEKLGQMCITYPEECSELAMFYLAEGQIDSAKIILKAVTLGKLDTELFASLLIADSVDAASIATQLTTVDLKSTDPIYQLIEHIFVKKDLSKQIENDLLAGLSDKFLNRGFDGWSSSVFQYFALVRILKKHQKTEIALQIENILKQNPENLGKKGAPHLKGVCPVAAVEGLLCQ